MNEELEEHEQLEQPDAEQDQQPEETAVENTEEPESVVENEKPAEEESKKFTQKEVDNIVAQRVNREQKKQAVLQQMTNVPEQTFQPQVEPIAQQPVYQAQQQQPNQLQMLASQANISNDDVARVIVQENELQASNPSLFTDYVNNIWKPLGDVATARLLSAATSSDGGLEKLARLAQTEEGRNKLYEIARNTSYTQQVTKVHKLVENYGKKPDPIIPERQKLANTNLPPSDGKIAKGKDDYDSYLASIPLG